MRKKRKKGRKKLLTILIPLCIVLTLIIILYFGYTIIFKEKDKKFLETINTSTYANITKYVIYGIHMNFEGNIELQEEVENISLVLSNGKIESEIPWELEKNGNKYYFKTSEYNNEGLNLERLDNGELYLLIKTAFKNEENKDITNYYSVQNKTDYKNLVYYTLTKNNKNNKIDIEWDTYEECPTLRFTIKETKLPDDVYDITLDPGHGTSGLTGVYDSGTVGYLNGVEYREEERNLAVALSLKEKLEEMGYKVAMTRNNWQDKVYIYDKMGSATMANDTKSKFSFAIHHNSFEYEVSYLKGLELYVANDINFDFANILVNNIKRSAQTSTSPREKYRVSDGIYQRFFTEYEISQDEVQPSNKTTNNIYYYYIREVGGISTGATNDGRYAPGYPKNEHYNSNNTAEPYLFELGYMNHKEDLANIVNNTNGYSEGIASALKEYLEQEK